jgi:secreted trypsin-like serine protease
MSCGSENFSKTLIYHGTPAYRPWFGLIYDQYGWVCGSTLIKKQWALTSKHCVDRDTKPESLSIKFGAYKLTEDNGGRDFQMVGVKKIILHKERDIALLKLSEPVKFNPRGIMKYRKVLDKELMITFGFGQTENGKSSDTLLGVKVRADKSCGKYADTINPEHDLCAGHGKFDSCFGDSGGPILHSAHVVGVVSRGVCGRADEGLPGIYAIPDRQWIDNHVME